MWRFSYIKPKDQHETRCRNHFSVDPNKHVTIKSAPFKLAPRVCHMSPMLAVTHTSIILLNCGLTKRLQWWSSFVVHVNCAPTCSTGENITKQIPSERTKTLQAVEKILKCKSVILHPFPPQTRRHNSRAFPCRGLLISRGFFLNSGTLFPVFASV